MLLGRDGGSKSRIRVAGLVRAPGAKKACTKHVEPYNRTRFALPKGISQSGPRMRFIIGFYILYVFFEICVEVTKNEKSYTTTRFAPLKDVLVKGSGIGTAIGFLQFLQVSKKVCKAIEIELAYTTVRSGLAIIAPVWCANQ